MRNPLSAQHQRPKANKHSFGIGSRFLLVRVQPKFLLSVEKLVLKDKLLLCRLTEKK